MIVMTSATSTAWNSVTFRYWLRDYAFVIWPVVWIITPAVASPIKKKYKLMSGV